MFDVAASIESPKPFDELSVSELCNAMELRLNQLVFDNEIEGFSLCDSYVVEEDE